MTNDELLDEIRQARGDFDAVVAGIGEERRTEPMFDDAWSIKDILVHISTWEKIGMGVVRNDAFPGPPPTESESGGQADAINAKVFEDNRDRAMADVVADAERTHAGLLEFVATLAPGRLGEPIAGDDSAPLVGELLTWNSHQHYREHAGWIRDTLAQR